MQTVAAQAIAVDHQLVRASRLSRQQRRRHLAALNPQVVEIERLSLRLAHQHRVATRPATIGGPHAVAPSTPQVLAEVRTQLDRLDEAHHELLAIERDSGLLDPDEVLAQVRPNAAPAPAPIARPQPGRAPAPARRPGPTARPAPRRAPSS